MKDQKLNFKQEKAAVAIAYGFNYSKIAEYLEISERTIYRWLNTDEFRTRVEKEKLKRREYAKDLLKNSFSIAVRKMKSLLSDNNSNVCLKAAQSIIDLNFKLVEIEENEQRLIKLEESFNEENQE